MGLVVLRMSYKLQPLKDVRFSRHGLFKSQSCHLQETIRNSNIFSTRYLWNRKCVGAEICRTFEERRDQSVDKTSDQNIVIQLFQKYLARGRKFSNGHNWRGAAYGHELFRTSLSLFETYKLVYIPFENETHTWKRSLVSVTGYRSTY